MFFFIFAASGEDGLIPEEKVRTCITKCYDFRCALDYKQYYHVGKIH